MPFQINIWLLLFGGLQGLLLSIVLVKKKTYREGYGFLIAYLLVMIAQILFKVADKQWLMMGMRNTYFLSYKFPLLYGPLLWLFTKRLTGTQNQSLKESLHFLPFIYSVLVLNLVSGRGTFSFLYFPMEGITGLLLQVASLLLYHIFSLRLWHVHHKNPKEIYTAIHADRPQWARTFIGISLFVCLSISVLSYLIYTWYPAHNWLRFGFLLLCFFIYWISFSALQKPHLFIAHNNDSVKSKAVKTIPLLPLLSVHRPSKKYANSTLSNAEAARIISELELMMHKQRIFTEPELTIEKLAAVLSTSRYILSQVLNERLQQSFYDYINNLRIAHAKQMLSDKAFEHHKIAAIAYDAGFNSLSTFNEVFKKIAGCTPSQFRNHPETINNRQRV
jgi:AraC-like DNA-binding protein